MYRFSGTPTLHEISSLVTVTLLPGGAFERPFAEMSLTFTAAMAAFMTLVFGGLLVYAAPNYTERTTQRVHDEPVRTFAYGLVAVVAMGISIPVLFSYGFVALFGVLLLFFSLFLVQIGYLAVGQLVTDRWIPTVAVAILVALVTGGLPWIGAALGIILGSLGLGAAILDYFDDGKLWTEEPDLTFGR